MVVDHAHCLHESIADRGSTNLNPRGADPCSWLQTRRVAGIPAKISRRFESAFLQQTARRRHRSCRIGPELLRTHGIDYGCFDFPAIAHDTGLLSSAPTLASPYRRLLPGRTGQRQPGNFPVFLILSTSLTPPVPSRIKNSKADGHRERVLPIRDRGRRHITGHFQPCAAHYRSSSPKASESSSIS